MTHMNGPHQNQTESPNDHETSDPTPQGRDSRRGFLGLSILVGIGATAGWNEYRSFRREALIEQFGSLKSPAFEIKQSLRLYGSEPLRQLIKRLHLEIEPEKIIEYTSEIDKLQQKIDALPTKKQLLDDSAGFFDGFKARRKLDFLGVERRYLDVNCKVEFQRNLNGWRTFTDECNAFKDILDIKETIATSDLERKYGPPDFLARAIIEEMTGRTFPREINLNTAVEEQTLQNNRAPVILLNLWPYTAKVLHFVFRAGIHMAVNHTEHQKMFGPDWSSEGSQVWSEACGLAFRAAAASYLATSTIEESSSPAGQRRLKYPEMAATASAIERQLSLAMLISFYGERMDFAPSRAAAIFDAALSTAGDIREAHSYLASNTELSAQMKRCIELNKIVFDEYGVGSKIVDAPYRVFRRKWTHLNETFAAKKKEYSES